MKTIQQLFLTTILFLGVGLPAISTIPTSADETTDLQITHVPEINFGTHDDDDSNQVKQEDFVVTDDNSATTADDTSFSVGSLLIDVEKVTLEMVVPNVAELEKYTIDYTAKLKSGTLSITNLQVTDPTGKEVSNAKLTFTGLTANDNKSIILADSASIEVGSNEAAVIAKNIIVASDNPSGDGANTPGDNGNDGNNPGDGTNTPEDNGNGEDNPGDGGNTPAPTIKPVSIAAMSKYLTDTTPAISGKGNPGASVTVEITSVADSAMLRAPATTFTATVTVDSSGDWALTDSDYGTSELAVNLISSTGTHNLNGYSVTASQDVDSSSANTNFELLALGTVVEGPGTNSYPGAGLNGIDTDGDGYTDNDGYGVLVSSVTAAKDEYLVMKFADSSGTQQLDSAGAAYALIMKRNPIAIQAYNDTYDDTYADSFYYTAYNDPATNVAQSVNAWYSNYVAPNSSWTDKFAKVTLNGKNRSWSSLADKAEAGTNYDVTRDTLLSDFLSNPTTGTGDTTAFIPSEADLIGIDTNSYPATTVGDDDNANNVAVNIENGYLSFDFNMPWVAFLGLTKENVNTISNFPSNYTWLRSPRDNYDSAGYLDFHGNLTYAGGSYNNAVRPAFWVKIN